MTGYPMVDAGMRELNDTGYMHNRVRMIVAGSVSYTHLRAHETVLDLVCRLLLEKKKVNTSCTEVTYRVWNE